MTKCVFFVYILTIFNSLYFYLFFFLFLLFLDSFLFLLVLVLFLCCCCCLKLFLCALRLAAGAFFFWKKTFSEKLIFLILRKNDFLSKIVKNTTFELLDHHHELNQKKLILLKLFMLKIDSTVLKLWSNPFFSCIFLQFSTPCTFLNV